MPIKNVQGAFLNGALYLGGGYTGSSKTDATVCVYNFTSNCWSSLPPSPVKWSAVCVLGNQLALIGGREAVVGESKPYSSYTNKIALWDDSKQVWDTSFTPMRVPRLSPVVISHNNEFLIVAGGKRGSLDYRTEILHIGHRKWLLGPDLPLPCLSTTSTVVNSEWYLMNLLNGTVLHTSLDDYLYQIQKQFEMLVDCGLNQQQQQQQPPYATNHWQQLPPPPETPFKISSLGQQPLVLCKTSSACIISVYLYEQHYWTAITGRFPSTLSSGLLLDNKKEKACFLFGGEGSYRYYSNKAYKLTLMMEREWREMKKNRHVTIQET